MEYSGTALDCIKNASVVYQQKFYLIIANYLLRRLNKNISLVTLLEILVQSAIHQYKFRTHFITVYSSSPFFSKLRCPVLTFIAIHVFLHFCSAIEEAVYKDRLHFKESCVFCVWIGKILSIWDYYITDLNVSHYLEGDLVMNVRVQVLYKKTGRFTREGSQFL